MIATTIHHLAMVATVYELGISQGSHRRQAVDRSRRIGPTIHHLLMVATKNWTEDPP
jgi:hypothetical protein